LEGSCEHGNKPSGFIKCWEFLEWLHNWRPLENGTAPLSLRLHVIVHFGVVVTHIATGLKFKSPGVATVLLNLLEVSLTSMYISMHSVIRRVGSR
jgi:hypothetical protein